MALNIHNSETKSLAEELAQLTGELDEIAKYCAVLPVLDYRSADEILYDKNGLPSP